MKLDQFLQTYPDVLFGSKDDEIFITLRILLGGMCSHRLAKLLNYACRFQESNERYLEIGTFTGFTLFSAGYESGRQFIGIDNFSEDFSLPFSVRGRLEENIKRYPGGGYTVIESDFRTVELGRFLVDGAKIGVFLIDGKHTYEDVVESVSWAKDYLSDNALIVFDDLNVPGIRAAIEEVKKDPRFEEIFFANSFYSSAPDRGISSDKYIHNGFSLVTFRNKKGA